MKSEPVRSIIRGMRKDEVIAKLRSNAAAIRAAGATSLYIYGSTARDEAREDSDVDVFIDYDKSQLFSLLDLIGVKHCIEDLLGASADLATRDSLHPRIKDRILAEAIRVY